MINWPGAFYSDNNPSRINGREVNGHRYYFTINLHESMGPRRDRTVTHTNIYR